jgi:hypothetical protein
MQNCPVTLSDCLVVGVYLGEAAAKYSIYVENIVENIGDKNCWVFR